MRELHHRRRFLGAEQRKAVQLLCGRSLPDNQRLHGGEQPVFRQHIHGQRRGVRRLLRPLLGVTPQEHAAHRLHDIVLQRRFGHQFQQPCVQDGSYTLRHAKPRSEDSQRLAHSPSGKDWAVLGVHGQDTEPSRHHRPALLLRHWRRPRDAYRARTQHRHRRALP